MMLAVATTGPPLGVGAPPFTGGTAVWALEREASDWLELLYAVVPESWLARGALLIVGGGPVSGSLSRLKIGVVLFLMRGAWAITSIAGMRGREGRGFSKKENRARLAGLCG